MTLFSIIIPLYNSETYISDTIRSLSIQTYQDFEVIIVDDNSTDKSYQVCKDAIEKYLANHHCVLVQKPSSLPQGVAISRNYAISLAKGDWVAFLDSDDWFHPQKLEITHAYILKDKLFSCLYTDINCIDGNDKLSDYNIESYNVAYDAISRNIVNDLSVTNLISTSTVVLKKEIATEIFNTSLNGVEDYYAWLNLSVQNLWLKVTLPLTYYRIHSASLMRAKRLKYYVKQNTQLVKLMKKSSLFSSDIKQNVEQYFMNELIGVFYANKSLSLYGWRRHLNDLLVLSKHGYLSLACRIVYRQVTNEFKRNIKNLMAKEKPY